MVLPFYFPQSIPYGLELSTVDRVYYFRAFGKQALKEQLEEVQRGWIQALARQIGFADENDMINMAELIIADTEGARVRRGRRRLTPPSQGESTQKAGLQACRVVIGDKPRRRRFVIAVSNFKEHICRASPRDEQWRAARAIFNEYLVSN